MPKRQNTYSPYCSLYISNITNHVNLFNNQELQWLAIISFILMILIVFDSEVKLLGEVGHQSLLGYMGVQGCTTKYMYT